MTTEKIRLKLQEFYKLARPYLYGHNTILSLLFELDIDIANFGKQLTAKDAEIAKLKAEHRGVWYKLWKEREAKNATLKGELEALKVENATYKSAREIMTRQSFRSLQSELDAAKEMVRELEKYEAWVKGPKHPPQINPNHHNNHNQ